MAKASEIGRVCDGTTEESYLALLRQLWRKNWPDGLKDTLQDPMPGLDLPQRLAAWARAEPQKTAIWFYGRSFSYAELHEMSGRLAARLVSDGIVAGDRVALVMPNCPQFTIAFLAILRIGAVHCPMSPLAKQRELEHQLKDCGAKAIIALQSLMPLVESCEGNALGLFYRTRISDALPAAAELPVPPMVSEEFWPGRQYNGFSTCAPRAPTASPIRFPPKLRLPTSIGRPRSTTRAVRPPIRGAACTARAT